MLYVYNISYIPFASPFMSSHHPNTRSVSGRCGGPAPVNAADEVEADKCPGTASVLASVAVLLAKVLTLLLRLALSVPSHAVVSAMKLPCRSWHLSKSVIACGIET